MGYDELDPWMGAMTLSPSRGKRQPLAPGTDNDLITITIYCNYNIIAMKCVLQVIGRLWRDSGVQAAFLRSNEYYLSDCARSDKDRFI
jgi:hypothetical protein